MDSALRVLHVTPSAIMGGGQRVAVDLVMALRQSPNVEARLCVFGPEHDMFAQASPVYVDFHGRCGSPFGLVGGVQRLRAVLNDVRPDVVHTHSWEYDVIAALATRGTRVRVVSHLHDRRQWLGSRRLKDRLKRTFSRLLLGGRAVRFVAVSEAVKQYACRHMGWHSNDVTVVFNGIETSRFDLATPRPAVDGPVVLGMAGRIEAQKGLEFLFRAVAMARDAGADLRLRLAGGGTNAERFAELARELSISDRVEFCGFIHDMPRFYQELDVFILPSLSEGLPLTVIEAMAGARPVIATDVGGTAEVLRDGIDGVLVPAADAPALAHAIVRLAQDARLRRAMGASGHERALAHFSREHMARGVVDVYRQVVADEVQAEPATA